MVSHLVKLFAPATWREIMLCEVQIGVKRWEKDSLTSERFVCDDCADNALEESELV